MIHRKTGIFSLKLSGTSLPHYGNTAYLLEETLRTWSESVNPFYFYELMPKVRGDFQDPTKWV